MKTYSVDSFSEQKDFDDYLANISDALQSLSSFSSCSNSSEIPAEDREKIISDIDNLIELLLEYKDNYFYNSPDFLSNSTKYSLVNTKVNLAIKMYSSPQGSRVNDSEREEVTEFNKIVDLLLKYLSVLRNELKSHGTIDKINHFQSYLYDKITNISSLLAPNSEHTFYAIDYYSGKVKNAISNSSAYEKGKEFILPPFQVGNDTRNIVSIIINSDDKELKSLYSALNLRDKSSYLYLLSVFLFAIPETGTSDAIGLPLLLLKGFIGKGISPSFENLSK